MHKVDIAIIGSGFGGSLLALLLARRGKSVVLVDRAAHPRFAIGESSTPIADLILADLAANYDLPRVAPLAQYGSWRRTYPELKRGRKRGFSYFHHEAKRPFQPSAAHENELLVAASSDNDRCDTHWYRADVDQFFAREAERTGVMLLERTDVASCVLNGEWKLALRQRELPIDVQADFLVDATGSGEFGRRWLGTADDTATLLTQSHAIFSHFGNVTPWHEMLEAWGARTIDHPFACDDAALHHVFDRGWMFLLRFDHGVVSAGFSWNGKIVPRFSGDASVFWKPWLRNFPSIAEQFQRADIVDPPGRLFLSGRLQRKSSRAAGQQWGALPHAFGFIDALHSTGIAWNLSGVERLAQILCDDLDDDSLSQRLKVYDQQLHRELKLIDMLVHLAYETMPTFRLFVLAVMTYFTATVTYENRRKRGLAPSFLCADDDELGRRLAAAAGVLRKALRQPESMIPAAEEEIRRLIEPYNTAGLCRPEAQNMYHHTAAR
ncbi:MAG: FAD-dependent oxidoreductase [Planctomycetaceae bacterium]